VVPAGEHQLAGGRVDPAQRPVVERGGPGPGVEPQPPQAVALVDVADSGTNALVEEELAEGPVTAGAGARHHPVEVEALGEDVGPEVAGRRAVVGAQLDHRGVEADRDRVVDLEDGARAVRGLAPALGWRVQVP
jgi:hypothetical protein